MSIFSITKTLLKSVFHGPYTTLYPLQKRDRFERTRGRVKNDIASCIFCSICEKRCPTNAIGVSKADSRWSIDRLRCIQCSYCVEVCPKKCLSMNAEYTSPSFGQVKDELQNARVSDHEADH